MHPATAPATETQDLRAECGELAWRELLPHFARGVVVRVEPGLDLITVARAFRDDDSERVDAWLQTGAVSRASDDDARRWTRIEPVFRAVVVAPWVLAQEIAVTH
ncbi:DUF2288 family protein [Thioalkalivibrio sp.]|uniref:DUF2288 family protein n=1 Tax=Thioalkalivibrio sp. TaxID=2093813 RepID=UPI0012D5BA41|nr:DUF2288 family protein [Thioalkalivibrio sp.]TVP78315.1 MAG: DUF2288 family protein [Thioalkalivibrio sp.]